MYVDIVISNIFHLNKHFFFNNVLRCLMSRATIIAASATADRLRDHDNTAGIGDNAAGISDNSAEIGDDTAGIVNITAKVIPC